MIIRRLPELKYLPPGELVVCIAGGTYLRYFCRFARTGAHQCHLVCAGAKSILDLGLTTEYLELSVYR